MQVNKLLLFEVPVKMILELRSKNRNNRERAKEIDCTYSYYPVLMKMFKKIDLVTIKRNGRECFTNLTEKGKEIANLINLINERTK